VEATEVSAFVEPGAHGGDGAALAARLGIDPKDVLDLSASHNPVAPDVAPLVAAHADAVRTYPDDRSARDALAAAIGVDPARIVVTNGGAEAIALVAGAYPRGWVDAPDFSLYERHLAVVELGAPRWRSNPHNPTGALAATDDTAFVWDEAFYALATGTWTRGDAERGSVVVGSLTKLFACPGLRVGYVLAPDELVAGTVAARRPEWSVNALACTVLPHLVETAALAEWAAAVRALRAQLVALVRAHGLEPLPSAANFVLVPSAAGLRDHLARRAVLVRDTASFGHPGGVRIAVPDDAGLERLALALREWEPA
jgi:histidinol-phosphate/aromatic aminotransferase/cobyric acid decarboxylase-like protein